MPETVLRNGKRVTLYDLSDCLTNATSAFEFNKHEIEYIPARQMAEGSAAVRSMARVIGSRSIRPTVP